MPIPYEVLCSECGQTLDVTKRTMDHDGDLAIEVEPCDTCLDNRGADVAEPLNTEITELEAEITALQGRAE